MIADLKPYPAMKDSGVPWLGEVPEHWQLRRTKTLLRERVEKGHPDEPLLAATQSKGVVRKDQYENRTVLAMKDLHLLKLVRLGDFVISLRSFQGGIEYAREQGIISPAYTILYPRIADMHGYLAKLFKSTPYVENLSLYVTGIRQGQNIDYEKLARAELPLPPLPEQSAIVRFLEHADRRIRRYIRAKQKLINLLEEQKQAIIHRAVTRGLDPNVRLKPSGVEWVGNVPEHWEVSKFKRKCRTTSGGTPNSSAQTEYYGGEIPWIRSMDLSDDVIRTCAIGITERAIHDTACKIVPAGAVLVAMYGGAGTIGKNGLLAIDAATNQAVCAVIPGVELDSKYLLRFVQASRPHWMESAKGARVDPNISQDLIRDGALLCPPLDEQKEIASFVDEQLADLQVTAARITQEIELLRQYRTRLMADVVTGKLDVRDAAARLPNEVEESQPLDEIESESDADEAGADNTDAMLEEAEA